MLIISEHHHSVHSHMPHPPNTRTTQECQHIPGSYRPNHTITQTKGPITSVVNEMYGAMMGKMHDRKCVGVVWNVCGVRVCIMYAQWFVPPVCITRGQWLASLLSIPRGAHCSASVSLKPRLYPQRISTCT